MPLNDPKIDKVKLLQYVEITDDEEYIGLFRIIPKATSKSDSNGSVTFKCEHVLAALMDNSLFQYHQLSNYETKDVIQYVIDQQKVKHFKRGNIDFKRFFHYSWENENILSGLFSVPKPFDEPYRWLFDTKTYPWTIGLVRPEVVATCRIKDGHNLVGFEIEENPMNLYNRIYPLGAGEGVNQLTIKDVNNGIPYVEDTESIAKYGLKEYIWSDKKFTNPTTLKANAESLLKKWKEPVVTWKASAADVSKITGANIDKLKEGRIVRLQLKGYPNMDLRIMKESKSDTKGAPGNVDLELGNVQEDLSTTNADMERRQQINELYSQGATNIMNFTYQDNADSNIPATIPFYIDDDVVNINTIELTYRTKKFRAYSEATGGGGALVTSTKGGGGIVKATKGGGGVTESTSSGGGTSKSTASGGRTSKSTASGGGKTKSSAAGGDHNHTVFKRTDQDGPTGEQIYSAGGGGLVRLSGSTQDITTYGSSGNHTHSIDIPAHTHDFSTPTHTHDFSTPNHTHSVTFKDHTHEVDLPNHTHDIDLPDHTHDVLHKIVELNTTPNKLTIKVDGNIVPHTSTTGDRINLVDYMSKDSSGKITRGRHEVEILPEGLARIEADLILRVFIKSQLGGTF